MRRWLKRAAVAATLLTLALAIGAAAPVIAIESGCRDPAAPRAPQPRLDVGEPGYGRAEGDTYLTYPEWYIVQAYADLADVTRQSSESNYDYAQAVGAYWSSMCSAATAARAADSGTRDQWITDYIIGLSFTVEMGLQGAYERSLGAVTVWLRGAEPTPEDAFNQRFLHDYAVFLQQTPWYRYPFRAELLRFWQETPWSTPSPLRSAERRFSLSLEYGLKGLYAVAIDALAGYSPADLTIMTVVRGPRSAEVGGVKPLRDLGNGLRLVETPRYEAYSDILRAWTANGTEVVEIAGNRRILVTVLSPDAAFAAVPGAPLLFTLPIQGKPGWHRIGLDTTVPSLTGLIGDVARRGAIFEHAYDY